MFTLKAEARGNRTLLLATVMFLAILVVPLIPTSPTHEHPRNVMPNSYDDLDDMTQIPMKSPIDNARLADQTIEGVFNPISVEQVGYVVSGTRTARTDLNPTPGVDLPLDEAHNWLASSAEIDIANLTNLYAINGTFEDGIAGNNINPDGSPGNYPFGWAAVSTSTNFDQIQLAGYDDNGRAFMIVQNYGKATNNPQHEYTHYAGTSVLLNQSIEISPYTEDFILSFDYLYYQGPLGSYYTGNCSIQAFIDGVMVWRQDLPSLAQRGVWYSTNQIDVNLAVTNSSTMFELGVVIDETFMADGDDDYDGNGLPDGNANTQYITVQFDDVSLVRATSPSPAEVELTFHAGSDSVPITGSSGNGIASITNSSYWVASPIPVSITSNRSVSFEYEARLKSHRFSDSNSQPNIAQTGVHYSVEMGKSPSLSFYSYVGFLGSYENLSMRFWYPDDWENVTVFDPFLTDVTSSCVVGTGTFEVPTSLIDRLGWWSVTLESHNYAKTLDTQRYNPQGPGWESNTVFRSTNRTRVSLSIGTETDTPLSLDNVNFTWLLPNATIWYTESLSGGLGGSIDSTGLTIGQNNSSAGLWSILIEWSNGTEAAFDQATFELHHRAKLFPAKTLVETDSGLTITAFLNYIDDENGEFLMDPAAGVTGVWPASDITFSPNDFRNQWEADFDTSLVAAGEFLVVANATRQYYDNSSCTFIIRSTKIDNSLTLDDTTKNMNLFEPYIAGFRFEDAQGTGIDAADSYVNVSGPAGGLTWSEETDLGMGDYSIEFYSLKSGTYEVTVTATKDYHEADDDTLIITVGTLASNLTLVNGSVEAIQFGEDYNLFVLFTNGTGDGLTDADVTVESMTPASGLDVQPTANEGLGYYSILLTPIQSDTYTVLLKAAKENHQTQFITFTLTITNISMSISLNYTSAAIPFDGSCTVHLNLTSSLYGGLAGATMRLNNPPPGFLIFGPEDLTGGIYRFIITPGSTGYFTLSFIASAPNHDSAPTSFTLEVTKASTSLRNPDGLSSDNTEFMSTYQLFVLFERPDTSSNVSDADIDVTFSSLETLEWSVSAQADGYMLSIYADELGRWDLTIAASKDNHQDDTLRFILYVNEIQTQVDGTGPVDAFYYGRSYSFTYNYIISGNLTGILGASIDKSGTGSDWLNLVSLGLGQYNITVVPQDTGSFAVDVTIGRHGFQDQVITFSFLVRAIPITVHFEPPTWTEGHPLQLTMTLTDDLGSPVTGAEVLYELYRGLTPIDIGVMSEDTGGIYTASVTVQPNLDQSYDVHFAINKDNHATTENSYQSAIVIIETPEGLLGRLWSRYGIPVVGAFAALGIVGASYRIRSKRRATYMAKALAVKRRFDDVNNFIGIVILHKTSGLPVYSNVLKGGFEEGMISAFITAITHFRSEFDREEDDHAFEVLPISDIIRAVPTKNLVCAFITVSAASMQQEARMIEFAKGVGKLMDDDLEVRPTEVNNIDLTQLLERYFDEVMDGFLLRYYKRGIAGAFPRRYRCLEEALDFTEAADCSRPVYLANVMTDHCKITEAEASMLVLESIELELVVPCEKHEVLSFTRAHWDETDESRHLPDGPVRM